MNKFKIGFDLDHVLADFQERFDSKYSDSQQFPQADSRFFEELKLLISRDTENIIFVKSLIKDGHDIYFVTAPSIPNIGCWTSKAVWIKKYFGEEYLKN